MLVVPVLSLLVSMRIATVYPKALGYDSATFGGFSALGATILILIAYVVYAMCERDERTYETDDKHFKEKQD